MTAERETRSSTPPEGNTVHLFLARLLSRFIALILAHQTFSVSFAAVLLLASMAAGSGLRVNNAITNWFLEDDPYLRAYHEFQRGFGNDEVVAVAIHDGRSIYQPLYLERIRQATRKLEALPHVHKVTSLATATSITSEKNTLSVRPVLPERGPIDEAVAQEARRLTRGDPLWEGHVVSKDGRTSLLVVQMAAVEDMDAVRTEALTQIRSVLDEVFQDSGIPYAMGGIGVIYDALNLITMREGGILVGLCYVLIIVCMLLILRSWRYALLGLFIVFYSVTVLMGIYALTGRSLNMITMILPTLMLVVGIADFVHVIIHFHHAGPIPQDREKRRIAVIERVGYVSVPCLYTSLTTATGFLALTTAPISLVRDLGIFGGIGTLIAFFSTIVFGSLVLTWAPPHTRFRPDSPGGWMRRGVGVVVDFVLSSRKLVAAIVVLGTLFFLGGIPRVVVDTYTLGYFDEDHPCRRDHRFIESNFGNYLPLELIASSRDKGGLRDPKTLARVIDAEELLLGEPDITKAFSLTGFSRRIHQVLQGGGEADYVLPPTLEATTQELLLYEMDPDGSLADYVTRDGSRGRISCRMRMMSVRPGKEMMERLEERLVQAAAPEADIRFAGYLPLFVKIIDYLVQSQVESFALAALTVLGPMFLFFRSLRLTLVGAVPNLLPIVILLGSMGWTGIPLDIGTVTIAAIVLGIAVDDTIHILHGFQHRISLGERPEAAVRETVLATGKAVVSTCIMLVFGFGILTLSSVSSVAYFGILSGMSLLAGLLCEFLVTPVLLLAVYRHPPDPGGDRLDSLDPPRR